MAVTYATVADVADFLRIPIDQTTIPNVAQVEKIINRMEDRIDRRTGHAWRLKTVTNEHHDLPLIYNFGRGTQIALQHRRVWPIDACSGDKVEVWSGTSGCYTDLTASSNWEEIPEMGDIYIRGFLFSVMRYKRVRVTYRYGGENGDTVCNIAVPLDIQDATVKLTAIDILNSSFRFDVIPRTDLGPDPEDSMKRWKEDVDRIIRNREEYVLVTT